MKSKFDQYSPIKNNVAIIKNIHEETIHFIDIF